MFQVEQTASANSLQVLPRFSSMRKMAKRTEYFGYVGKEDYDSGFSVNTIQDSKMIAALTYP